MAGAVILAPPTGSSISVIGRQMRDPWFVAGSSIYLVFLVIALFADVIAPNPPKDILFLANGRLASALKPGLNFPFGTTTSGCDIFSQLIHGARSALLVGTSAAFVVASVGTLIGLFAGYFGGWIDALLMRLADIALGLPLLPSVIVLAAFLGPNTWNIVLAISVLLWPNSARIIRAQVMSLRERAYIEASRASGSSHLSILFRHIAPNILPLAFLFGSIAVGWAILTEASVSFLGFADPDTTTWGFMLQDAYVSQALSRGLFNWFVPPGICIVLLVSAGFFISRGYEQLLFPRLRN